MSNTKNDPVDPFAGIDLDRFKTEQGKKKTSLRKPQPDKEAIKAVAEQNDFQSRQAAPKKKKIITKTFSLFQDECNIINDVLRAYLNNPDEGLSQPSGSDIVRAALHIFAEKNSQEQVKLIKEHRGRGRK
ncbi:hypothetical protein [Nitrosomonas mobilis]|jgi:hypothetical protein|uniref:Uncharacterized protein n=1 Tax=Nitrosomonas mobilis TaxID=51642 RepID=A0A1G5SK59_9PROT|nr:hypothetical protein [Nitrosomonas mobilis]SCZ86759.1 hypothetical protein NSMM_730009 [Nitrosomonas mobilis]HNO75547.1 hypothetical protein [Nitrosomonas mobilis]